MNCSAARFRCCQGDEELVWPYRTGMYDGMYGGLSARSALSGEQSESGEQRA